MSNIEETTERKIGVKVQTNSGAIRITYRFVSTPNGGLLELNCDRGMSNSLGVAIDPGQLKKLGEALLSVYKRTQERRGQ